MDKEELNKLLLKTAYSEPIKEEEVPEDAFSDSCIDEYPEEEYEEDEYDYIDDDHFHIFTRLEDTFEKELKPKLLTKFLSYTLPHKKDIKETLDMLYLRLCNLSEISQDYSQY